VKLNIRKLASKDWNTLCGWWKDWGFENIPAKDFLPEDGKGGLIVETEEGVGICSIFMYTTNSKLCQVNWPLSNKNFRNKEIKNKAFDLLMLGVENMWKTSGGKYLVFYGSMGTNKFQERLQNIGYIKTDVNCSALVQKF